MKFRNTLEAAQDYVSRGWAPVPVPAGRKAPVIKSWPDFRVEAQSVPLHFKSSGNIGLILGEPSGLVDVDLDAPEAVALSRFLPKTGLVSGRKGSRGSHRFYKVEEFRGRTVFNLKGVEPAAENGRAMFIEVRGTGFQTLVAPSRHPDTGEVYEWEERGEAASISSEELVRAVSLIAGASLVARYWPPKGARQDAALALIGFLFREGLDAPTISSFIEQVGEAAGDKEVSKRIAAVNDTTERIDRGDKVCGFTKLTETLNCKGSEEAVVVVETLAKWLKFPEREKVDPEAVSTASMEKSALIHPLTDLGNAERLATRHGNDLRFCGELGWLVFDGQRWVRDRAGEVGRALKDTVRSIPSEAEGVVDKRLKGSILRWAKQSEAKARLSAMSSLAETESSIATVPELFDENPWLFNVKNGTVDLRTGELRPYSREDLITKLAPVQFDPAATCPIWESFLGRILVSEDLISFMKRASGYAMTGDMGEQVMFLLYGGGANGKSTFLETLRAVLGDYAMSAPFTSFTSGKNRDNGAREDIARLRGARFVTAVEADAGVRLSESVLKQITGGDMITARFLFKNSFDFRPECKLFLAANHKPEIRGTDEGIWRRIRLVPFEVFIPAEERDPNLLQKLQDELPGILNWMIKGCLEWQREGLGVPAEVAQATAGYREEMDPVAEFLETECTRGEGLFVTVADLYSSYASFCGNNALSPMTKAALTEALKPFGIKSEKRTRGTRYYVGVASGDHLTELPSHPVFNALRAVRG